MFVLSIILICVAAILGAIWLDKLDERMAASVDAQRPDHRIEGLLPSPGGNDADGAGHLRARPSGTVPGRGVDNTVVSKNAAGVSFHAPVSQPEVLGNRHNGQAGGFERPGLYDWAVER